MSALRKICRMSGEGEFLRWLICSVAVVIVHGAAMFALVPRSQPADDEQGAPIAFIELAPVPVAPPTPPTNLAVGPLQLHDEAVNSVAQDARPAPRASQAPPKTDNVQKTDIMPPPPAVQPQTPFQATPPTSPTIASRSQAEAEASPKPMEQASPQSTAAIPSAPPSAVVHRAEEPAGPARGARVTPDSARVAKWEQALAARIERSKRYPPSAEGLFGVSRVAFTIDRAGRLLAVRIAVSSGLPVLDEEAVATVRRAAPFPSPPTDVGQKQLSIVAPIRYVRRRSER
jgi:periplasmic protein TonB